MGGIERVVFNLVLTKLGFWEMQREREREEQIGNSKSFADRFPARI